MDFVDPNSNGKEGGGKWYDELNEGLYLMKNKIAGIVFILVAIGAVGTAFYFRGENMPSVDPIETSTVIPPDQIVEDGKIDLGQLESKLETDNFEIDIPAGWRKTAPALGSLVTMVKVDEQINDPEAKKAGFKSYFAVGHDSARGKTLAEYTETVKGQLRQIMSGVVFTEDRDLSINGESARAFEVDFNELGIDFKVFMVVVEGTSNDVWVISFNTLQSLGDEYRETVFEIVESFKLKPTTNN